MKVQETKDIKEVAELMFIAKEHKLEIKFIDSEPSGKLSYSSAAEIYPTMSPTQMWHEIQKKLQNKGVNIYRDNFDKLIEFTKLLDTPEE